MVEILAQLPYEVPSLTRVTEVDSPPPLTYFPHGIDQPIKDRRKGYRYEENCFRRLNEDLTSGLAIGPHIIDCSFSRGRYGLQGMVRPDGIWLDNIEGTVALKTYFEFKSGEYININNPIPKQFRRKITGLDELTNELRGNPKLLPKILKDAIGNYFHIPPQIEIPDQVDLIFYTPQPRPPADSYPHVRFLTYPSVDTIAT